MACRHSDIERCENDIRKVKEILKLTFDEEEINYSVTLELENLSKNCNNTFSCVNMEALMNEEKKLNKDITELLPELNKKCSIKISELNKEKYNMKMEDIEYHSRHHVK